MAVLDVQFTKLPSWSCAFFHFFIVLYCGTRCEGGLGGLFGLAGQGVTKIASGRLEVMLTQRSPYCVACIQFVESLFLQIGEGKFVFIAEASTGRASPG
eukprot:1155178-Pelagomonas_calceolata.AAC.1